MTPPSGTKRPITSVGRTRSCVPADAIESTANELWVAVANFLGLSVSVALSLAVVDPPGRC